MDASKIAQKILKTCGTDGLTDQHSNLWSCVHATENPHIWLCKLVILNYFNSWRGYIHSCAYSFVISSVSPFINHWIQNILYNVHAWSWPLVTIYQRSFPTEWTLIQHLNVLINASLLLKWWMLQPVIGLCSIKRLKSSFAYCGQAKHVEFKPCLLLDSLINISDKTCCS